MVIVNVVYRFEPEHVAEVEARLEALTVATKGEPGCLGYAAFRSTDDPAQFLIHEAYADEAAIEAHRAASHYAEHAVGLRKLALSRELGLYRPLSE